MAWYDRHIGLGPGSGHILFIAWLVIIVNILVSHFRLSFWRCPECGKPFHVSWLYGNPFARRCVHCGMPKWGPNDAEHESDMRVPAR